MKVHDSMERDTLSPEPKAAEETGNARRRFLKNAIAAISLLTGAAVAAVAAISLLPKGKGRRREKLVALTEEENAPRRGAREIPYTFSEGGRTVQGKTILVQAPEGLIALSPSCTHFGCFVVWQEDSKEFHCPCHGGRYDMTGRNIDGPPPGPLARFPLERKDGTIYITVPL